MAFADLLDLRTAVLEDIGRADIADVFPRLVKLAESRFNRELRLRDQMTTSTLTFASGSAAIPADMLEIIGLYSPSGREYVAQPSNVKLQGVRNYYAVFGGRIYVAHDDGDKFFDYYAKIPTIADSMTATNWLLDKYPDIYLYGVGYEAAKHIRDAEMAGASRGLLQEAILDARVDDERAKFARARVRVDGVTP